MPSGLHREQLIGMAYFDCDREPPQVVIGYVPRDLPGLDLSDPRTIRYRNAAGGFTPGQDEFTDYLSHISHLRVARSPDGVHFTLDPDVAIHPMDSMEEYGVEDPRITEIDGVFHITYVAVSRLGITTARMTTTDFRTFERQGTMLLPRSEGRDPVPREGRREVPRLHAADARFVRTGARASGSPRARI